MYHPKFIMERDSGRVVRYQLEAPHLPMGLEHQHGVL